MTIIPVAIARKQFCKLLERVEAGERIVITRHRRPIADMVPSSEPDPRPPKPANPFTGGLDLASIMRGDL